MNLRYEILRAISKNPGAPIPEICDVIDYDRQKTTWSVRDCAKAGLLTMRRDDVTGQPGYTLSAEGKKRLADGPGTKQGSSKKSQPEVEKNTGSSASGLLHDAPSEGAAVQPNPAPVAAAPTSAAPVAADVNAQSAEFPPQITPQIPPAPIEADKDAGLIDSLLAAHQENQNLISIASETLAEVVHCSIDTSDMDLDELAKWVAQALTDFRQCARQAEREYGNACAEVSRMSAELANKTALVEKLEHLLQSARNEAEHLRKHAGAPDTEALRTVPLEALLDAVSAFVPAVAHLTLDGNARDVTVSAFGQRFEVDPNALGNVLGHIDALDTYINPPF